MSCLGHALLEALDIEDQKRTLQVLARGANLEEKNQVGNTPLLIACTSGLSLVAQDLVRRRADLEARERRRGFAALHLVTCRNDVQLLRELLENRAQVESLGHQGETAVHLASLMGHCEVLELLLEANASPNTLALDGKGALSHACYRGHLEPAKRLLSFKARVDAMDVQQRRPLHWAAEMGREEILELLLPSCINAQDLAGATALHLASQRGHVKAVQRLVEARAEMDLQGAKGETALMLAALNGHVEVLQCLSEAGANLNLLAHDGLDALRLASEAHHVEAMQQLLAMGAEVPPEGLMLPLTESDDELVLTKSLAKQLLLEGAHEDVARRWGFGGQERLLQAMASAGCAPEDLQKLDVTEVKHGGGLFDWDEL